MDRKKVIKDLNDIAGFIAGRVGIEQARNFLRTIDDTVILLKEDCHNCKLECLLQKYDQMKEKYDELLKEQEEKMEHLNNITLEYEKEVFRLQAMLKEHQEAVEPYQHDAVWLCGNCEKEVVGWDDDIDGKEYRYPFCRQCGKVVKWE